MAIKKLGDTIKLKREKFSNPDRNVSREFQIYGYQLAEKLDDLKHKALYIKFAKELPREMLDKAFRYAIDYTAAKSKAKIFMFKLKDLRKNPQQDLQKKP